MVVHIMEFISGFGKTLAVVVCFIAFAAVVKPEVGTRIIPSIVEYSETVSAQSKGVDLDPIYLSDGTSVGGVGGLYSSRVYFSGNQIYGDLVTADTRVVALNRFLNDYDSPLAPYAETFVATADAVELDWRLVAAISGVESAFGRITPYQSNNAWGWKGGPGGDYSIFPGWEDGIIHVTMRIADGYGTDMTVFEMEPTYCPPCGQNPAHAWANGVSRYMYILSQYQKEL